MIITDKHKGSVDHCEQYLQCGDAIVNRTSATSVEMVYLKDLLNFWNKRKSDHFKNIFHDYILAVLALNYISPCK